MSISNVSLQQQQNLLAAYSNNTAASNPAVAAANNPQPNNSGAEPTAAGGVGPAGVYESSAAATAARADNRWRPDPDAVNALLREAETQRADFMRIMMSSMNQQAESGLTADGIWGAVGQWASGQDVSNLVEITPEMRAEAQELVSEDGFYGVRQTSERILALVDALAGTDPNGLEGRLEVLRGAAERAFENVRNMFGGNLPEISELTIEAVRQGFEERLEAARAEAVPLPDTINPSPEVGAVS